MKEAAYWISLAHLPRWGFSKINNLIIRFFHANKISIEDFFGLDEQVWRKDYELDDKQIADLLLAKSELANNAFLAESLFNQGYEILPIISPEYSKTLKENLKVTQSPPVLYIKGDKQLLKENAIAIVGSRQASKKALTFTDTIAKKAVELDKVVVSGFAKGVDKQALDSALAQKGKSCIVLPQGIMTFSSGYKEYYKQIVNGEVLVLSTFTPKAPWRAELAMARNPIIYGLANEIFVAESADKGGTWSGVMDGLRRGRTIYVRMPDEGEINANDQLIAKGAIPVDIQGNKIENIEIINTSNVNTIDKLQADDLEVEIRNTLDGKSLTLLEIQKQLKTECSSKKLSSLLNSMEFIEVVKKNNSKFFKLKKPPTGKQISLF